MCDARLKFDFLFQIADQLVDRHTYLFHGITVTDGNAVIALNGLEVYCDAERCANLILAAIALANRTCLLYTSDAADEL